MGEALRKAVGLDGKDRLAALGTAGGIRRHEGVRVHIARVKRDLARRERKERGDVARCHGIDVERRHAQTIMGKKAEVYHGGGAGAGKALRTHEKLVVERLSLADDAAVLSHETVATIDDILG